MPFLIPRLPVLKPLESSFRPGIFYVCRTLVLALLHWRCSSVSMLLLLVVGRGSAKDTPAQWSLYLRSSHSVSSISASEAYTGISQSARRRVGADPTAARSVVRRAERAGERRGGYRGQENVVPSDHHCPQSESERGSVIYLRDSLSFASPGPNLEKYRDDGWLPFPSTSGM
jgi:hypothetical protein